jgi:hypothetical protein
MIRRYVHSIYPMFAAKLDLGYFPEAKLTGSVTGADLTR